VEKAQAVQTWAGVVASLANDLTPQERRQLLANNVSALRDVLTDADGVLNDFGDAIAPDEDVITPDTGVIDSEAPTLADTEKSLGDTVGAFAQRMTRIVGGFIGKTYSRLMARGALRATLSVEGEKAYRDGKVSAGGGIELTRDDELELSKWRTEQDKYIGQFLDEVQTQKVTDATLPNRIELWVNKSIKGAYNLGMSNANIGKFYMWQLGATREHCKTCLTANGQVHRMRAWKENGILPQSSRLECGGWRCDCRLVPVEGARLFGKGSLRAVRRTLKAHKHHDHTHEE
jgi:hypothetical protein